MFLLEQILNSMPPKDHGRGGMRGSGSCRGTPLSAASKTSGDEIEREDVESTGSLSYTEDQAEILRLRHAPAEARAQLPQTSSVRGRGAHSGGPTHSGGSLQTYLFGSLKPLPIDIPAVNSMADVYLLQSFLFNALGTRSFLLRRSREEMKLQDAATKQKYLDKWTEFEMHHAPGSMNNLQHDYYNALSQHLRKSVLLARFADDVSSEVDNPATQLWNAVMRKYPPHSPTMKSMGYACAASQLLKGPDQDIYAYDRIVVNTILDLQDMLPLNSSEFTACMVYAGCSNSEEKHWRSAAQRLREKIELDGGVTELYLKNPTPIRGTAQAI